MNTYTLMMSTRTGALPWQYEFESPSDGMARETARRWLKYDPAAKTAMKVGLFSNKQELIAEFVSKTEIEESTVV